MKINKSWRFVLSAALCAVLTAVCLCSFSLNAQAEEIMESGTCGEDLTWTLDSEGTLTVSGTGPMDDFQIYNPDEADDQPWCDYLSGIKKVVIKPGVTSIGLFAFAGCSNLSAVTIPDSVTRIEAWAFINSSNITSLTIPNTVTYIGDYALDGSFETLYIPESVENLEFGFATGCFNLKKIIVDKNNPNYSSDEYGVLFNKDQSHLICAPVAIEGAYTIPNTVTNINHSAFQDCRKLSSVTIPNGVTHIDLWTFSGCIGLTDITIPDSVAGISDEAFYNCKSLISVNIPDRVSYIGDWAFSGCEKLTKANIPDTVTEIAYGTFQNCSLESITIPSSVKTIGKNAFIGCDFSEISIPDSVTSIGERAFENCASLYSVKISESVDCIGDSAFSNCTRLVGIWVDEDNANYSSDHYGVLFNKEKTVLMQAPSKLDGDYIVPDTTISIANYAFQECYSLKSVNLPDSLETIGDNAFYDCTHLERINIPQHTTTIGYHAFWRCRSLETVAIPKSVTQIGAGAFARCVSLTGIVVDKENTQYCSDTYGVLFNKDKTKLLCAPAGITGAYSIPSSVLIISGEAFAECSNLTAVNIPNSVTSIYAIAFTDCYNLKSVIIPSSVNIIQTSAFYAYRNGLEMITFIGDAPVMYNPWTGAALTGCYAKVYYPANNDTWTTEIMNQQGDSVTWIAYEPQQMEIKTQPKTAYAIIGDTVKTAVKASGDGLTYQWYFKNAGGSSYSRSSVKTATYSCKMSSTANGRYVKCKITDQYGNAVWTDTVRLKMKDLAITSQPVNETVKDGATARFTVKPNGANVTYQWQYRTSSSGSWKTAKATGNTTKTLSVPASVSRHGYQYRCRVTDSAGNKVYTKTVTLNVLGIKTQPVSKTVVDGKTAKFTVTATGTGLKYQWQYRTSSAGSWKAAKATGNKTKTMSVPASVSRHGYQYRCKITDSAGNTVYTKAVSLYVLGIKSQPASKTVKVGATAKFTVTAVGKGLSFQWQYRTSTKGSWKNTSATGSKTKTLSVPGTTSRNGYQYRCKITDSAGNVIYSNIVKLTVKK